MGAETLQTLHDCGANIVLMRCAGFNNVDVEKAKELGMTVKRVSGYTMEALAAIAETTLQNLVDAKEGTHNGKDVA